LTLPHHHGQPKPAQPQPFEVNEVTQHHGEHFCCWQRLFQAKKRKTLPWREDLPYLPANTTYSSSAKVVLPFLSNYSFDQGSSALILIKLSTDKPVIV